MTDTLRDKIEALQRNTYSCGTVWIRLEEVLAILNAHTAEQPAPDPTDLSWAREICDDPEKLDAFMEAHPLPQQPAPDAVAEAWQAMDTAPTDGTKFVATNGRLTFTTYSQKYYEKFPHEEGGPIYQALWTAEDGSSVWPWNPTHWTPLPVAAPAKEPRT